MRLEYAVNGNAKRAAARAGHTAIAIALLLAVASLGCGDREGGGDAPDVTATAAPFVLMSGTAAAPRPRVVGTPTAAPTPQPIVADDEVWRRIAAEAEGTLRPLLRPRSLPAGLETVLVSGRPGAASTGTFSVEYAGRGAILVIAAGALHPPPGFEPGHQEQLTVRGQRGVLAVGDDRDPNVSSWVFWQEPGSWRPEGSQEARPSVAYLVRGQGMSPKELLAVVEALQPWTPE